MYMAYTPYSPDGIIRKRLTTKGRKRFLTPTQCLGLVLMWTRSREAAINLSIIFGVTYSCLSLFLRFGRRLLLKVLKNDPNARVTIPKNEVLKAYADSIKEQYSALGAKNVAFAIDGLKLNIQKPGHDVRQSAFYNRWTHGHYVSNVFVF